MFQIRNLISKDRHKIIEQIDESSFCDGFGILNSPETRRQNPTTFQGAMWASDNDAYTYWLHKQAYNPLPLLKCLAKWQAYSDTCLFVNAPDVIADFDATVRNFWYWQPLIKAYGFKVAFTVQNGYRHNWQTLELCLSYADALFIGCTNSEKYHPRMWDVVKLAKERGLWVHNGRVNNPSKIQISISMGCDSFDGTSYAFYPPHIKAHIPFMQVKREHIVPVKQRSMFEDE